MDAVTNVPTPVNEPVRSYAPGSAERASLQTKIKELAGEQAEITMTIGGQRRMGAGDRIDVVAPHDHRHVLGFTHAATQADAQAAVDAALAAAPDWRAMSFDDRAAVFLKAADLLAGPWRDTLNAATMLGQSKTVVQAEIDSAAELIDFWRFNPYFARQLLATQPNSVAGAWNRTEYRPLEGFVFAVTPFNFTSIGGNLPTAPALMGNTVIWKPASTQLLAAYYTLRVLEAAGLPPGVINLVTGHGREVSEVVLHSPHLAGIHFTGSTTVFQGFWRTVGENISGYKGYPRLVGETGGKDFIWVHPSADLDVLRTVLVRGAFEYQGQKCSAASRAYIPRSVWNRFQGDFLAEVESLPMGDPTDFRAFMGAVIDAGSFRKLSGVIDAARTDPTLEIVAGGSYDDSTGWFVRPTVMLGTDPTHRIFTEEFFGPILGIHVYDDADYDTALRQMESVADYALTGSVIAQDRAAIAEASDVLRFAAGNFYINDKPTGAVVGQQPFGGARASGTNDKAGSAANLMRWVNMRAIKETFVPPTDYRYPSMG